MMTASTLLRDPDAAKILDTTIVLIDPEGMIVWRRSQEFKAEEIKKTLVTALPYYRNKHLLNDRPLQFHPESAKEEETPLRFPGKILADEAGDRLFISDSNHNRIVIATAEGKLLDVIGSGAIGRSDGDFHSATFHHPQGCALAGSTLYVADTENHLIRKVDLTKKTVTTIAGTGQQGIPMNITHRSMAQPEKRFRQRADAARCDFQHFERRFKGCAESRAATKKDCAPKVSPAYVRQRFKMRMDNVFDDFAQLASQVAIRLRSVQQSERSRGES